MTWLKTHWWKVGLAALIPVGLAVALPLALSGGGSMTVHGALADETANGCVQDGQQAVVIDPTGKIIGVGTYREDTKDETQPVALGSLGVIPGTSVYDFSVTVPTGEARYGVRTGAGTVWFTPQQFDHGPQLQCS